MQLLTRVRNNLHLCYALYGMMRYRRVYKTLCIIGVTGTDGKSSTVLLSARMLRALGIKTAHYSSVSLDNGSGEVSNAYKMTTPGKAKLHRFLAEAVEHGCRHAVIELTSEGVLQWRHLGIPLTVLAYTNITPEHIERHGSFEKYIATKLSLCRNLRTDSSEGLIVWNATDPTLQEQRSHFASHKHMPVSNVADDSSENPFLGRNITMATAILKSLGLTAPQLQSRDLAIPGRFECFGTAPRVIVDYAHTPHAVTLCLEAARNMCAGRLIHVFGAAGGGRDTWKRPKLAELSEQYADIHILTEENSFDEPVEHIIADIQRGFNESAEVHVCPKREDAVRKAFQLADPRDIILLTAKGSEEVIAGPDRSKRPYNERSFVQLCLK